MEVDTQVVEIMMGVPTVVLPTWAKICIVMTDRFQHLGGGLWPTPAGDIAAPESDRRGVKGLESFKRMHILMNIAKCHDVHRSHVLFVCSTAVC